LPVWPVDVEFGEPAWPALGSPDPLTGSGEVEEGALGELADVPPPALLAGGLDAVPAAGLVALGEPVCDPVLGLVPVLLVVELAPGTESVESAGAGATVAPLGVGAVPGALPSAGVAPGGGTLCVWSPAGFGAAGCGRALGRALGGVRTRSTVLGGGAA